MPLGACRHPASEGAVGLRPGSDPTTAVIEACRLWLRPILMTAFAFILGVLPQVTATGAGAEMRRALGTPAFYVAIRFGVEWLRGRQGAPVAGEPAA